MPASAAAMPCGQSCATAPALPHFRAIPWLESTYERAGPDAVRQLISWRARAPRQRLRACGPWRFHTLCRFVSFSRLSGRATETTSNSAGRYRGAARLDIGYSAGVNEGPRQTRGRQGLAEKVAKLGVGRERGRMYYVKDGAVWSVARRVPGVFAAKPAMV